MTEAFTTNPARITRRVRTPSATILARTTSGSVSKIIRRQARLDINLALNNQE